MPKIRIVPTKDWFPESLFPDDPLLSTRGQFTLALLEACPGIMRESMGEAFDEHVDTDSVVPLLEGPNRYVRPGITPDIEVIGSPNWSEKRSPRSDEFLDELVESTWKEIRFIFEREFGERLEPPQVDFDVDFVMGPGAATDPNGHITARWPKTIGF